MRNKFVLPNILTTVGLSCGLFVIFRMSMIAPGTVELDQLRSCLMLILFAAFIDTLDGALARVMKLESEFGGFFDSMSDAVTFGVAPAVLALKALSPQPSSPISFILYIGAMVFSIAGVLRLVRFSTMALSPQDPIQKSVFVGLPITSSAVAMLSLSVFLEGLWEKEVHSDVAQILTVFAFLFLGYLMISRFRFPSLKALHYRYTSMQLLFFSACVIPIALILLLQNFVLTCVLISWGYILFSWLRALYYIARGKKELAIVGRDEESAEDEEPPQE